MKDIIIDVSIVLNCILFLYSLVMWLGRPLEEEEYVEPEPKLTPEPEPDPIQVDLVDNGRFDEKIDYRMIENAKRFERAPAEGVRKKDDNLF